VRIKQITYRTVALLFFALAPRTTDAELVAALSSHLVAITTSFSGTNVLLFGTSGGGGDVVVVIRGPETSQVVRRKGRRFGLWVNEKDITFERVPGYYTVAANKPLEDFVPISVAERHQIGIDYLKINTSDNEHVDQVNVFRKALIRNKQRLQLYGEKPGHITFLGGTLFRTDMPIPANAPVGSYTVSIYLVADEEIVSAETTPLVVSKVGFEAQIFDFAHRYSLAYGVLAILIAVVAGWTANFIFRRD